MTKRAFCWALWKYGVHRPPRGSRYITDTLCSPPHFLFHILLLTYWFPKESITYRFYNFRKQVLDIHVWELSEPPIWWSCLSGWTQDFFFLLFSSWSIFPGRDDRFWYHTNTWRPSDCRPQSCQHRIQASSHFSKTASLLYWFNGNLSKHLLLWNKNLQYSINLHDKEYQ